MDLSCINCFLKFPQTTSYEEKKMTWLYNYCSFTRIGVNAAQICPNIVTYFCYIQQLFVFFFSSNTARWSILKDRLMISFHSQSKT